ncbi:hypothetical protein [Castellaniella sp.]|uniref:hypothetical protein n=1 Tax=Castellaniella sp. TaxID=1955812 RepID=UPI002AFE273A|nr:hypothetical protein [Castellaniella sp.]
MADIKPKRFGAEFNLASNNIGAYVACQPFPLPRLSLCKCKGVGGISILVSAKSINSNVYDLIFHAPPEIDGGDFSVIFRIFISVLALEVSVGARQNFGIALLSRDMRMNSRAEGPIGDWLVGIEYRSERELLIRVTQP